MASRSWEVVGSVDDLTPIITNISPSVTPLFSKFSRVQVKNTTHGALTDTLPQAQIPSIMEGADFTTVAATARGRLDNYTQIFDRGYWVTDTDEAVMKRGLTSEIEYQMGIAMKAIALDVELAIVTAATAVKQDAANVGKMGGLPYFNTVNVKNLASSPLTESAFNDAIQLAWNKGGVTEMAVVSGKNKRTISGFTAGAQKTRDQKEKKAINVIDVYLSDFGEVSLMAHRQQLDSRIDIIESQYFRMGFLVPFHREDLPKKGHRVEKVISGQATLECRAKDAHSCITGIA
ncbi:MAG: DUF5309 family protein [Negativicutes bacterium]|nr:DUF5309 family protein [Negativicutes bacterium]MDR3591295.1 DUF5309 family protein [Negativicutes bacterium]